MKKLSPAVLASGAITVGTLIAERPPAQNRTGGFPAYGSRLGCVTAKRFSASARYHHAKLVKEWLNQPGRRIKLHFIPAYCPHLNPIERLWGLMHKHVTHNKCYATCAGFAGAALGFLRESVPRDWQSFRDTVTDNFRIISPKEFRVMN